MRKTVKEKKSRLAPTNLQLRISYYVMGDKFIRNLVVTQMPQIYGPGYLASFVNSSDVKIYLVTHQSKANLTAYLNKQYQEMEQEYFKTNDPSLRKKLDFQLAGLNAFIEENIRNNDKTHSVFFVFSVYADTADEVIKKSSDLKNKLNAVGIKTAGLNAMQLDIFKTMTPLFLDDPIPETVQDNIMFPMSSMSVAGLYPFIFETLKDPKGLLLGWEFTNGGVVLFDQFYYINEKARAVEEMRMNGNMIVVGKSGSGKTTLMNLMIRYYIMNKIMLIWIDPEDKCKPLTVKYGGTFVQWGSKDSRINLFDLKKVSSDDDDDISVYDTEIAIYNVIDDIKIVLKYLYPNIAEDTLSVIGEVAIRTYQRHGITFRTDFRHLGPKDFPTFSDFEAARQELSEEYAAKGASKEATCRALSDLEIKLKSILNEWSIYFNGHTSIKVPEGNERRIVSFGTKVLFSKSPELRNALLHIMTQYAWSLCLDESQKSAFVLDEASTIILEEKQAERIAQFQRRSRKYKNVTLIGTQEPRDFADERVLTSGKAIFNNAAYKAILSLELDAVNDVKKLVNLNESEEDMIQDFRQGEGLFVFGKRRMCVRIFVTDNELAEMGQ